MGIKENNMTHKCDAICATHGEYEGTACPSCDDMEGIWYVDAHCDRCDEARHLITYKQGIAVCWQCEGEMAVIEETTT